MIPSLRIALLRTGLFLVGAAAALARPLELADMFRFHRVSDPQVSPDGRTVAFVVTDPLVAENKTNSDIWVIPSAGGEPRRLTTSPKQDRHPRWSPDGRWIAFESNRDGSYQIWLMPAAGGEARKLTQVSTEATGPVWSPSGDKLGFVSAVYAEFSGRPFAESDKLNQARLAAAEKNPVKARLFDQLLYRHWDSWVEGKRQHVFVLAVKDGAAAGDPCDVTPGDNDGVPTADTFSDGDEFAFSPDGKALAFTAPPLPTRTQAWSTNHDLWLVDLATGQRRQLTTNPAADGSPHFSPDGKYLAYHAQTRPGFEADRWQLMLLDLATGKTRNLTDALDLSAEEISWAPDGRHLYFNTMEQAAHSLWQVDPATGRCERLVAGGSPTGLSLSGDGRTGVYALSGFNLPPELMLWQPGSHAARRLTHLNDALLKDVEMGTPESVTVTGAGGTPVQMWIIKPPHFDPAKKYPLVFWVHGGPQGAFADGWSTRWNAQLWAAQGYVVSLANPRGSTGFGQQFTDEISRDWAGKVYTDLMACLSYLEARPWIDPARMAAAGASYGGYMMNWFEGHTDKFRCIVNHDGVFNTASMYGSTEEVWFDEWEHGKPWEADDKMKALSPHLYAANFKTPMLIIHSDLDFRIPITEGMQAFTTLQRQGVRSRLLMFPDEGHWVLKPGNSELWHQTIFAWLAEYLK
jgi:dipeptidyl aminopeptidase/acylaminoacyl peptidase